jgi:type IV pilus assembly protein PilW
MLEPMMRRQRSTLRRASRGLSIVELLIGTAIGLFILAGSLSLFANHMASSRRLALETRFNQDLRATLDLITRDLRRGAYWGNALEGTSIAQRNPYAAITVTPTTNPRQILYSYTRDPSENSSLDSNEVFGFRLAGGAIQMCFGGSSESTCNNWQTLSNSDILTISQFSIAPTQTEIDVRAACANTCTDTALAPTCPRIQVRNYTLTLTGTSTSDAALSRTLRSQVRVRNDALLGSCPV